MKTTAAYKSTRPATGEDKDRERAAKIRRQRQLFFVMAINVSWQMAIVVLVPIIGGFELDRVAGTSPALVIIGFLVAMAGTFVVMKHAFDIQNDLPDGPKKDDKKW